MIKVHVFKRQWELCHDCNKTSIHKFICLIIFLLYCRITEMGGFNLHTFRCRKLLFQFIQTIHVIFYVADIGVFEKTVERSESEVSIGCSLCVMYALYFLSSRPHY
jgi:hypothetical protein